VTNCGTCKRPVARDHLARPEDVCGYAGTHPPLVAALYVDERGVYAGMPDVEVWGISRDARLYPGPHPVVAHPPCARWCRLAGLVEARWGHKRGDDGGCFAAAKAAVQKYGGVLEHPAYSDAFAAHGLPVPLGPGWQRTLDGGAVCYVEQGRYGHPAKKATWLYAVAPELPPLNMQAIADRESRALVSWCGNHTSKFDKRPRVGKAVAAATPPEFAALLLSIARSVKPRSRT
jgi:hypothetical protein